MRTLRRIALLSVIVIMQSAVLFAAVDAATYVKTNTVTDAVLQIVDIPAGTYEIASLPVT